MPPSMVRACTRVFAASALVLTLAACGDSATAPVAVEAVVVTAPANSLDQGATLQLLVAVLPFGAPQDVIWSTSNPTVAAVSGSGLVTGVTPGPVTITATSTSNPSRSGSVPLTVLGCLPLQQSDVSSGGRLLANSCHLVQSPLTISSGTLVIEPGVRIEFGQSGSMTVSGAGRLRAEGTVSSPIVFTGADAQGRWRGIRFTGSAGTDNVLQYVTIENAGSSNWTGAAYSRSALFVDGSSLVAVRNSTISGSQGQGVTVLVGAQITFENNTLRNNAVAGLVHPNVAGSISGNTVFQGNTENVMRVSIGNTDVVSTAQTWRALSVPYEIQLRTFVESALTIEAGATVSFAQGASMIVRNSGSLRAAGTASQTIRFGARENLPGFWQGLQITTASAGNVFEHVVFEYGGGANWTGAADSRAMVYLAGNSKAVIRNSTFRGSALYGLWVPASGDIAGFDGNTFTANARTMIVHPERAGAITANNQFTNNTENRVRVAFGNTDALTSAQTWNDFGAPFYLTVRTFVRGPLTLAAGVELEFAQNASLIVNQGGSMRALGSPTNLVRFSGGEDLVGYWQGIEIETVSAANRLENVVVRNAGSSGWFGGPNAIASINVTGTGFLALTNVRFERTGGYAMIVRPGGAVTCSAVDQGGFLFFNSATNSATPTCP